MGDESYCRIMYSWWAISGVFVILIAIPSNRVGEDTSLTGILEIRNQLCRGKEIAFER